MNIKNILKKNWKRITNERVDIFNYITTKHIFTSNDLLDRFNNIWRASIFRIVNLFLDLWVIRKVNLWNKVETYELYSESNHHEHMKCEKCNSILSFTSSNICNKIFEEAKLLWFTIKSHSIWVYGICSKCL